MNNKSFNYIKKISIYTLVFIFCFMIGNVDVRAEWEVYKAEYLAGLKEYRGSSESSITGTNAMDGTHICSYTLTTPAKNDYSNNITMHLYRSDRIIRYYRGGDGGMIDKNNDIILPDTDGLNAEGLNKVCNSSDCVCPVIYYTDAVNGWDIIGGSQGRKDTGYDEWVPTGQNGSKVCIGTRADYQTMQTLNSNGYKKIDSNTEVKTALDGGITSTMDEIDTIIHKYYGQINTPQSEVWKNEQEVKKLFDGENSEMAVKIKNASDYQNGINAAFKDNKTGYNKVLEILEDNESCDSRCGSASVEICTEITAVKNYADKVKTSSTFYSSDGHGINWMLSRVEDISKKIKELYPEIDTSAIENSMNDLKTDQQELINSVIGATTNNALSSIPGDPDTIKTCEGLLNDDLKSVISKLFSILGIAVPILLIVLSAVDFSQVVISQDQDAMKKAVSKVIKRAIAALAIFFIPFLVDLLLKMPGISDWVDTDCDVFTVSEKQ